MDITIEQIDCIINKCKRIKQELKSFDKLQDKDPSELLPKKTMQLMCNIGQKQQIIEQLKHSLHVDIVKAKLANRFDDDRYGEKLMNCTSHYNPTSIYFEKP